MDKQLLFKDISSRLPYGVKVAEFDEKGRKISNRYTLVWIENDYSVYGNLKPYLFPLSSMTKEQKREYHQSTSKDIDMLQDVILERINGINNTNKHAIAYNGIDWLNAHHFDYRGLIEKGLAIDCTNLNIY